MQGGTRICRGTPLLCVQPPAPLPSTSLQAASSAQGSSCAAQQQEQQQQQQQQQQERQQERRPLPALLAAPGSPALRIKEMLSAGSMSVAELEPAAAAQQPAGEAQSAGNAAALTAWSSLGSLPLPSGYEGGSLGGFSLGLGSLGEPGTGAGVAGSAASVTGQQAQEGAVPPGPSCWPAPDGGPEQPSTPTSAHAAASGRRAFSSGSDCLGGQGSFRARWTVHHGFQQGGTHDDLHEWLDAGGQAGWPAGAGWPVSQSVRKHPALQASCRALCRAGHAS